MPFEQSYLDNLKKILNLKDEKDSRSSEIIDKISDLFSKPKAAYNSHYLILGSNFKDFDIYSEFYNFMFKSGIEHDAEQEALENMHVTLPKKNILTAKDCLKYFADGEHTWSIPTKLKDANVLILNSVINNNDIFETLTLIDTLKQIGVKSITLFAPYLAYARQDRRFHFEQGSMTNASINLLMELLFSTGLNRLYTINIHSEQVLAGFNAFNLNDLFPIDYLNIETLEANFTHKLMDKELFLANWGVDMLVSPDVGMVKKIRSVFPEQQIAIIDKHRSSAGVSEAINIVGDVGNKRCLIIDDIIDGAGTICNAAELLYQSGASEVKVYATHGIFSGKALERISASNIKHLYISDSLPKKYSNSDKITSIPVVGLLLSYIISL